MKREMHSGDWHDAEVKFAETKDGITTLHFKDGRTVELKGEAEITQPDLLCNLCGLTCLIEEQDYGLHMVATGGYHSTPGNGSGALDDCTKYKFSLCEFCLDWLFGKFQLPVDSISYINGELVHWAPAEERVNRDDWRQFKKEFFDEFKRRNAHRAKPK